MTSQKLRPRTAPMPDEETGGAVLRLLLTGVAFAAGITGMLLLAWPGSTGRYFSWELDPDPLAGLIGGSYVASLFVFGIAVRRSWLEVRGLVTGTLALTIPMLTVTFIHLEAFDFGRWQAWAWVLLFIASPISFGTVLWQRRHTLTAETATLPGTHRFVCAVLSLVFLSAAVALWWNPEETAHLLPFDLPPFGGRVLGSWSSFLAFLAGWSAWRARAEEVRIPLLGVTLFMAGAIAGAVRNFGDLEPPGRRGAYLIVLGALLVMSAASWWGARRAGGESLSRL